MKKLFIILLSALSLMAVAQQKPHIAVYVTGEDPMNEIIANRLMSSFINTGKYMPVERSSAFLAAINKEQGYQRTGEVDEEQIAALGKQFGIQYICVVSVLDVWSSEKYITSRILDVTSAEVIGSCSSNGSIANAGALMTALDDLSNKLKKVLEYSKSADFKKVAVYVSKTGNRDVDIILGDQLVAGFAHSSDYVAVERTNAFLKQIKKEGGYQQSGTVDDDDLIRMGKQFGVQLVCVADVSDVFGEKYVSARLIDVESAEVANTSNANSKLDSMEELLKVTDKLAKELTAKTVQERAIELAAKQKANEETEKMLSEAFTKGYIKVNNLYVATSSSYVPWSEVATVAAECRLGGYTGWRVPTVSELSMIHSACETYYADRGNREKYPNLTSDLLYKFHYVTYYNYFYWVINGYRIEGGGTNYEKPCRECTARILLVHDVQ